MTPHASAPAADPGEPTGSFAIALAGAVALAVAMGIGRFAFTPVLPMMLHDGVTDLQTASWLASMNYLGYLAGALMCTFQPWIWARLKGGLPPVNGTAVLRGGLVATGVLTLAMALPVDLLWPLWRFAAGVASALVFVFTSGWCLAQLARLDASGIVLQGAAFGRTSLEHTFMAMTDEALRDLNIDIYGNTVNVIVNPIMKKNNILRRVVEAFSMPDAQAVNLCVQWHPEWQASANPVSVQLFQAFGEACRAYRARKRQPAAA